VSDLQQSKAIFDGHVHCWLKHTRTHPVSNRCCRDNWPPCGRYPESSRHTLSGNLCTIITLDMAYIWVFFLYIFTTKFIFKKKGTLKITNSNCILKFVNFSCFLVYFLISSIIIWNILCVTDREPLVAGNGSCCTTWTRRLLCLQKYSDSSLGASKFGLFFNFRRTVCLSERPFLVVL
jgi:hypothetical protein